MKRAIVLLGLLSAFAGLTFACSDGGTDTLKGADTVDTSIAPADPTDPPPAPAATTTPQKTTSASSVQATNAKADAGTDPLAQCDPAKTTTKADCAKCCATKTTAVTDVNNCACGTSTASACGSACAASLCTSGIPDISCGLCLFQASCDFSNVATDIASGGDAADACLQTCEAK